MYYNYFGYRNISLADAPIIRLSPNMIKTIIRSIESFWMDIVSISKVDIIIRTPIVFFGNIISNVLYAIIMGEDPIRVLKMTFDNMKSVLKYTKIQKEITALEIQAKVTGKVPLALTRLRAEQERNPAHELMEAGMYQAIVDDINKSDRRSTNDLARKVQGVTKHVPQFIKNGVNWLYLNENTSYFEVVTKATQMSDFVSRLTVYQLGLEKAGAKMGAKRRNEMLNTPVKDSKVKQDLIWKVLDVYINYGKPDSPFENYLNQMGFVMFTKYAKRIQRAIVRSGKEKPVNIILSAILQEAFLDVDDIWDQHPLVRSYTNYDQDMLEHVTRALMPSTLQAVGIAK
jgi:hypothetical protein